MMIIILAKKTIYNQQLYTLSIVLIFSIKFIHIRNFLHPPVSFGILFFFFFFTFIQSILSMLIFALHLELPVTIYLL